MSDPLAAFDNWCDNFPNSLNLNDQNLMNNITYFDQVLDFYRANFVLCEPYQQFTNKFVTMTAPNALAKLLNFTALDSQLYQKIIFIFAKYIDLAAQLFIRNINFYHQYSTIPEKIYSPKSIFMKSNPNGLKDLKQTVKDYPYSALKEWIFKSPVIDWSIFHYIIEYLIFIHELISLENEFKFFIPSFCNLFEQSLNNLSIINQSTFLLDAKNFLLIEKYLKNDNDDSMKLIIKLILSYVKNSNNLDANIFLISNLLIFQDDKNACCLISNLLNEYKYDDILMDPKTPKSLLEVLKLLPFKFEEKTQINISIAITKFDDKSNDFTIIFLICARSFQSYNSIEKASFLSNFLKEEKNAKYYIELLFYFDFLTDKDKIPDSIIKNIINLLYVKKMNLEIIIKNSKSQRILLEIFLCLKSNSNEKYSVELLSNFKLNELQFLSSIDYNHYHQVLLKDDSYSFWFYMICIHRSKYRIDLESIKAIWAQMIPNEDRVLIFQKYFELNSFALFEKESLRFFVNSILALNFSEISKAMIGLIVDIVYAQDEQTINIIDKSIILGSLNQMGLNELFKSFLFSSNQKTSNYAEVQLLNITTRCDVKISIERNEILSEFLLKNSKTENHFIRCFDFLNDFLKICQKHFLLEDFGFSPLKESKEQNQKKTMKVSIELYKKKVRQPGQPRHIDSSEILKGEIKCLPSDLCFILITRVEKKFRCKNVSNARCFEKKLNTNSTLEMNGITDGSIIQLEYDAIIDSKFDNLTYLDIFMPEMSLNRVPIYQKALDLLHDSNLNNNLAMSILKFIFYLPVSFQLMSLLDSFDSIEKAFADAQNCYERQLYLQVILKAVGSDAQVKKMMVEHKFYRILVKLFEDDKKLNKPGLKTGLAVLVKIWPTDENDEFVNEQLPAFISKVIQLMISPENSSNKLIKISSELLLKINEKNGLILTAVIKSNILSIVKSIQFKIFGKIISKLNNKNEIYQVLIPHFDEFVKQKDRCPFFFDALFSSIDDESKDLEVFSNVATSNLYQYGKSAFLSLCDFIITRPDLLSKIELNPFFDYVESNEITEQGFRLIYEIYQKVPEKREEITRKITEFVSIELPEYNINESFIMRKSLIGNGITNLGNTCYINSALQLLFNINQFKNSFLKSEILKAEWQKKLQIFFAIKNFSYFPVNDPSDFINNYEMMGQKINKEEQQDTAEFLLSLIDGLPDELSSMFYGSLSNIIEGINSLYSSNNIEKFLYLSLDVEGCNSLENSLNKFIQSEIFPDYKVQDSKESIIVKKSTLIQNLPKVLLIQLRRFIYDLISSEKLKLNSFFSFPFSIDMSKYCLSKEKQIYNLAGFVLHSGNADVGHFHYIGFNKKINKWVDYNDSITSLYQISNIENDAFGSNAYSGSKMDNQSAYILVYEKAEGDVIYPELNENDISKNLMETVKKEKTKIKRTHSLMSDNFYNLAMCSNDALFLYHYFTKIIIHLSNEAKCLAVKNKLQNLLRGNKKDIQKIIEILEKGKLNSVTHIIYIRNTLITQAWIDFLKFIINNSENGESYCFATNFLNCIDVFKNNPVSAKFFAEVGFEVLKYPDGLVIAQCQEWHVKFIIVLATILTNANKNDSLADIDIDMFLNDLILMSPIIEKNQKNNLCNLNCIIQLLNPKTRKLYGQLMDSLDPI